MTDKPEEHKEQIKSATSGLKLTFANRSIHSKLMMPGSLAKTGPVVVEVKRGKAASNQLIANSELDDLKIATTADESRRLTALQRSIDKQENEEAVSTLSSIAKINSSVNHNQESQEQVDPEADSAADNTNVINANAEITELSKLASLIIPAEENKNKSLIPASKTEPNEEGVAVPVKKSSEQKKLKKSDIFTMLSEDISDVPTKTRSLTSIRRAKEKEQRKNMASNVARNKVYREVTIPEVITVGDLAHQMTERTTDVIRELMKLGIIATSNQSIDADTAEIIATGFGHTTKRHKDVENIMIDDQDQEQDLVTRAPIVTIMGHVDHGKTSLLDALRDTDVAAGEHGGITQHIGAYSITVNDGHMITFIDTPGHEAFTTMRSRGAKITDIVVLVVAADDGIKTQTIEAINHAKAAMVPIIVAVNKIDKPDVDIDKIKQELLANNLVPEEFGGDVIVIGVSAYKKTNLDKLLEAILLVAEMQALKANPNTLASGVVIETKVDVTRGVAATVIVQRGTLRKGDTIVVGTSQGKVKRLCADKGHTISEAGPSLAVEVYGLDKVPSSGDLFKVVSAEQQVRGIIDYRLRKAKDSKVTAKTSMENLFLKASGNSKIKDLLIIIKGDTHGTIEAIVNSLLKIESDEVLIKILHSAVGGILESDINLAKATNAMVLGFNVKASTLVSSIADRLQVKVRYYTVIYNLIEDIKSVMSGMLSPIMREHYIGSVMVREIFNITKMGKIAGSYVTKGLIRRGSKAKLLRDDVVIHEGKLKTLKRFKEDVKEVREGFECGIAFENYDDIKIGDIVEVFEVVAEQKKL